MIIENFSLTEMGAEKFNRWFDDVAKEGTRMSVAKLEVFSVLGNSKIMGKSLSFALPGSHTVSGRPELLILNSRDVEIEWSDNDPDDE